MSDFLWSHGLKQARLLCSLLSPRVCSNLCPLSLWCYLTIPSSVVPFSKVNSLGLNDWFLSLCLPKDSQESSPAPQFKSINSWVLSLFMVHFSQPYMAAGKTIPLIIQTFVGKMISLLFNKLSRLVIVLLPKRSSVQFSCSVVSDSLRPHGLQHPRPPCPSPTPWVYSNSRPLSRWCHPTISSSVVSFSSCLQSFSASGSFQMSQLFISGGQSIGVSASTQFFQWTFRTDLL